MADRRVDQYSPKTSPRGGRSPVVPRQDSTGTLKTTISLGKTPSIVHSGPFYLLKELPRESDRTGQTNLMATYKLENSYNKFCGKKVKDSLSSFLPNLPGNIDSPSHQDNSSLRSLIDKPPIGGKEILQLTSAQLSGFRLHPGPLPAEYQYRFLNQSPVKRKHKHKKHRHRLGGALSGDTPTQGDTPIHSQDSDPHEKKHKKQKRHDEDRKKKKKEKKKKKQKHSPEHPNSGMSQHDPTVKALGKL